MVPRNRSKGVTPVAFRSMDSKESRVSLLKKRKIQVGIGLGVSGLAALCGFCIWLFLSGESKQQVGVEKRTARMSETNIPAKKKALEALFKKSGVTRDLFNKLVANPPQVNSAGEVLVGDTFTEEEKKVVKNIDRTPSRL